MEENFVEIILVSEKILLWKLKKDIFETVLKMFGAKFWQFWKHVVLRRLKDL